MGDLSDFSDEDKAKLLDLADRGSIKLYNMPFNALLQKLGNTEPSIEKETLFMNMVFAGYADFAASNALDADPNSTNAQNSETPAPEV